MRIADDAGSAAPSPLRSILLIFTAIGGLLRLGIGMRDLSVLDNLFIPDDTYYTLAIARSLALGQGPTVDGEALTNGFQPLLAFLLAPFFHLNTHPDALLRIALLIPAIADTGAIFLLGLLCYRLAGTPVALLGSAFWALSPVAISNALNGLETSLAIFMVVAALWWWSGTGTNDRPTRYIVLGVLWGLALLARVDTSFAVATFGILMVAKKQWRTLFITASAAMLTALPWWGYSIAVFGSPVPESGAAVHEITRLHRELYLQTSQQIGWMLGTLVGPPLTVFNGLKEFLYERPVAAIPLALVFLAGAGVMAARMKSIGTSKGRDVLMVLLVWGGAVILLYTFHVPALWFFARYLLAPCVVLTIVYAWGVNRALELLHPPYRKIFFAVGIALFFFHGATQTASFITSTPEGTVKQGLHGAMGYREVAHDILSITPEGATVGSLQSGALSYYGFGKVTVVNLDGVVDGRAAEAFRAGELGRYAQERGVTHVADWPFNVDNLLARGGKIMQQATLRPIGEARPQGRERMGLFEVQWGE